MNLRETDSITYFNQEIEVAYKKAKIHYKTFKYYYKNYVLARVKMRHKYLIKMERLLRENYRDMDKIAQKGNLNKEIKKENERFKKVNDNVKEVMIKSKTLS